MTTSTIRRLPALIAGAALLGAVLVAPASACDGPEHAHAPVAQVADIVQPAEST